MKDSFSRREHIGWVDLLRVLACFLVVFAHCCDPFVGQLDADRGAFLTGAFAGSLVRCSVPLFVMMTGVLLLPVGEGMGAFYRRRIGRIVPPLLFWSLALPLLFFAYLHTFGAATQSPTVDPASYTVRQLVVRLYTFVFNFNYDTTPLWYLYMLVGLYLVMPVLGAWLRQASQRDLQLFLAVWGAALLVVSINTGAYMAETVRGGILSIDPGQTEGAKAIGMTHFQTMTSVILPQAIRNILPQIGNNYIINVKDTSVMFIIGFTEFFASHRYIVGINNKYFPSAVIEMAGYLAMTLIASGILRLVEKLMDGSDSYELVQEDPLTMTAGTYSHPKRGSNYDEQSKEFRERTEQELKFGRSRGDR